MTKHEDGKEVEHQSQTGEAMEVPDASEVAKLALASARSVDAAAVTPLMFEDELMPLFEDVTLPERRVQTRLGAGKADIAKCRRTIALLTSLCIVPRTRSRKFRYEWRRAKTMPDLLGGLVQRCSTAAMLVNCSQEEGEVRRCSSAQCLHVRDEERLMPGGSFCVGSSAAVSGVGMVDRATSPIQGNDLVALATGAEMETPDVPAELFLSHRKAPCSPTVWTGS